MRLLKQIIKAIKLDLFLSRENEKQEGDAMKLNFRSTYYRWGDLLPRDLFLYPRSLTSITVNSSVL